VPADFLLVLHSMAMGVMLKMKFLAGAAFAIRTEARVKP